MEVSDKASTKRMWFMLFDLIIIYVALGLGFQWLCGLNEYKQYRLDDDITASVHKADGSIQHFYENNFDEAVEGDTVYIKFDLPEVCPYEDTTVCASIYNCAVEVVCDGNVLYEYGQNLIKNGGELGNILITANIPKSSWGSTVIVKLTVPSGSSVNKFENVLLMPSQYALKYVLINHEIDFIFCISIVGFSMFALLLIITIGKMTNIDKEGVYLFLFFIAIGVWELGSARILYIFVDNPTICANIEYTAMFFMPIPFGAFLTMEFKGRFRKVFVILTVICSAVFVVASVLNYTTTNHYYKIIHFERYIVAICLVITFVIVVINRERKSVGEQIIQVGTVCTMLVLFLEIVRCELSDIPYFKNMFSESIASFGVMIFVFSLLCGYYNKFSAEIVKRKNLERVAYTDGMTGIANRTAVINFLNELNVNDDYGIVFFDVNDLKKANDVYGHETGDKLITVVAKALHESFEFNSGFYGRYGGDEFVAGFYRNAKNSVNESMEIFRKSIENANNNHELPFDIMVAYGIYVNDPTTPLESEFAVKKADTAMYVMKNDMKSKKQTVKTNDLALVK